MLLLRYMIIIIFLISLILCIKVYVHHSELDSVGDSNRANNLAFHWLRIKHYISLCLLCFMNMIYYYKQNKLGISVILLSLTLICLYIIIDSLDLIYCIEREANQEIFIMKIKNFKIHTTFQLFSFKVTGKSINYSGEVIKIYGKVTLDKIKELKKTDNKDTNYLIIKYYSESKRIVSINSSLDTK